MKKIIAILLSVVLVLAIGAGTCLVLAQAEPEEGIFADRMGEKTLDLKSLVGGLFGGNVHLPYEMVNCTIRDALAEKGEVRKITGLMVAPSDKDNALWMRVWVQHEGREWVVTVETRFHAVQGDHGVTGLELMPTHITVGKLPVPSLMWPSIFEKLADRAELDYEEGIIRYDLPDLDLALIQVKDIRTEPDGFVVELGMGSLWGGVS